MRTFHEVFPRGFSVRIFSGLEMKAKQFCEVFLGLEIRANRFKIIKFSEVLIVKSPLPP